MVEYPVSIPDVGIYDIFFYDSSSNNNYGIYNSITVSVIPECKFLLKINLTGI